MGAAFMVLALRSGRHVMLFGIAAAPLLAAAFAAVGQLLARRRPTKRTMTPAHSAGRDAIDVAVFLVIVIALIVGGSNMVGPASQERATASRYPVALLPDLDRALASTPNARIFNEYTWGGFLIEKRPGLRVFIDGRNEVSGDVQLRRYADIAAGGPDAARTLEASA